MKSLHVKCLRIYNSAEEVVSVLPSERNYLNGIEPKIKNTVTYID